MNDLKAAAFGWLHDLASHGVITTDAALTIRGWNRWLTTHSERSEAEVVGRSLLDVFPDLVTRRLDQSYQMALNGQVIVLSQALHHYLIPMPPVDRTCPFAQMQQSVRIAPLMVDQQIVGTITVIDDVTERVVREDELRRQAETQSFLSRASFLLGASLNLDETIEAVARLAIPRLGDIVVVAVLDQEQQPQAVAVAHVDDVKEQMAKQLEGWFRPRQESNAAFYTVLRSNAPALIGEVTPSQLERLALPLEQR